MKKKLFLSLLALLLCMSLLFVSCDKETAPAETTSPVTEENQGEKKEVDIAAGKAAVVKLLKEDSAAEEMLDAEAILKNLQMTVELDLTLMDETTEIDGAMKDGLLYLNAMGEETYLLLQENGESLSFVKGPNGQWMLEEDSSEEAVPPEEDDGTEEMMAMLQGASFENITAEDIDYVDGKFVLKNDFLVDMLVESLIESITGGEQFDSPEMDEAIAEAKTEFENLIDTMKIKISFRVEGEEVTQMIASFEMDASAMQQMGSLDYGTDGHVKMEIAVKMADGGKTFKEMSLKMDLYEEGVTGVSMNFDIKMRSKTRVTISGEITLPEELIGEKITMDATGTVLLDDASGFPKQIPAVIQGYMN